MTARELILRNFEQLFQRVPSIPISLLLDPFIRANQVHDSFPFTTFDYEFLTLMAKHPKLKT